LTAKGKIMDYKAHADKAVQDFTASLKDAPEGSPIIKANQHLLADKVEGSTWAGAGELTLGGFIWWAADCALVITDVVGIGAVDFSASGTGFMVGGIESELVGAFVFDPAKIPGGKCHYSIVIAAVEGGVATLTLYNTSGTLYGTFAGPAEGLAAGGMSGSGDLVVKHT
jgi:hypothetical protein